MITIQESHHRRVVSVAGLRCRYRFFDEARDHPRLPGQCKCAEPGQAAGVTHMTF